MSRWMSPQTAARRARKAARKEAQLRKEERRSKLLLVGFILFTIAILVAYFVFYAIPRLTKSHHHHNHNPE